MKPLFLTLEKVLELHQDQLNVYGGSSGIRDMGLLQSAVAMPQASFGGEYLHEDLFAMAAAYLYHLVQNHPFVDGNKRIGLLAMLAFLKNEQFEVDVPEDILYNFIIDISTSKADYDNIVTRLKEFTSG